MRKLLTVVVVVAVSVGVGVGCGRLGKRVDEQIELVGSELTGVPVTVDKVKIRVGRGLGEIHGLTIANPEGYVAANAFEMDQLLVNLGIVSSVVGEPLVLDELVIDSPVVNLEKNAQGGSNLKDIADNVERNLESADRKSAETEPASEETPGEPIRIAVRSLVIQGVTLNVRRVDGSTRSGTLPSIEMTDVGGDEGRTPGSLGLVIVGAMAGEMLKQAVARELIERTGNIREALDAENILAALDARLELTPEQRDKVRPAVERVSGALVATIDVWAAQGFIDRETLSEQLMPVAEEMKAELKEVLDGEQLEALKDFLSRLNGDAAEVIRFAVIERVSERLGVTPEQADELRSALRENLVAVGDLLREFAERPDRSFEDFRPAFDALRDKLSKRLENVLSADQMAKLATVQEELVERIRNASFADG